MFVLIENVCPYYKNTNKTVDRLDTKNIYIEYIYIKYIYIEYIGVYLYKVYLYRINYIYIE